MTIWRIGTGAFRLTTCIPKARTRRPLSIPKTAEDQISGYELTELWQPPINMKKTAINPQKAGKINCPLSLKIVLTTGNEQFSIE